MIDPITIKIADQVFRYGTKRGHWKVTNAHSPWRIAHDTYQGWHAYNLDTRETLTTSSQSLRQLRTMLALKIRRQEP